MSDVVPYRVQELRDGIITCLPKRPNVRATINALEQTPLSSLILFYLTWRYRFVVSRPRTVRLYMSVEEEAQFRTFETLYKSFLQVVEAGQDLTSYLSRKVLTSGYALRSVKAQTTSDRWIDKDFLLTADGLYHFHYGLKTPDNPRGRSSGLILAEVAKHDFTILAISDHNVFKLGHPERERVSEIVQSYRGRNMVPGKTYIDCAITTSGHLTNMAYYADNCVRQMRHFEPNMDSSSFPATLFQHRPEHAPSRARFRWGFSDMTFGFLEEKTGVFFETNIWDR